MDESARAAARDQLRRSSLRFGEEGLGHRVLRIAEEFLRRAVLDVVPVGEDVDVRGDAAGEAHRVGDDDHGLPALGQIGHGRRLPGDRFNATQTQPLRRATANFTL